MVTLPRAYSLRQHVGWAERDALGDGESYQGLGRDLPVDIVFSVGWQVIVDDQRDLLDVNTSGLSGGKIEVSERIPSLRDFSSDETPGKRDNVHVVSRTEVERLKTTKKSHAVTLVCKVINSLNSGLIKFSWVEGK